MGAIRWGTRGTRPPHFIRQRVYIMPCPPHFLFRFHNILVSHQPVTPTFYNEIASMHTSTVLLKRVNEIFARVNERRGVNEISARNSLYPLVTCICFVVLPQLINNHEQNDELQAFELRVFSSQQRNTSEKPHYGPINCECHVMTIDFTERWHASFSRVVESLLCSLHERPVGLLLCQGYLIQSQYFRKFHSHSPVKTRHPNTVA